MNYTNLNYQLLFSEFLGIYPRCQLSSAHGHYGNLNHHVVTRGSDVQQQIMELFKQIYT